MTRRPKDPADYKRPTETGDDYEVGKGRPPKETQFKPGQSSANPRGRPSRAAAEADGGIPERRVSITIQGKRKKVSMSEAILMTLENAALAGDIKSQREVMRVRGQRDKQKREAGLSAAEIVRRTQEEKEKLAMSEKLARHFAGLLNSYEALSKLGLVVQVKDGDYLPTRWSTLISEMAPGGRSYPLGVPPEVEAVQTALGAYIRTLDMTPDEVRAARKSPAASPPA